MGAHRPFLVCWIFIVPLMATSYIIVDELPEVNKDYNNMKERRGSWQQNSNRASKNFIFRASKRSKIEPDGPYEGVGEDPYIIIEGLPEKKDDLDKSEKRGSPWQNSNFFRASKRLMFRATKRSSADSDPKELQAWKRMNFRPTKRASELAPEQEDGEEDRDMGVQRRGENLIRVLRQQNSNFFRQQ